MIKARVLSTTMSAKPDAPIEVNMEMWVFDNGSISCPDEVVIMTEEEYKALDSVSDVLRKSLLDEREKTRKLEEENNKLKGGSTLYAENKPITWGTIKCVEPGGICEYYEPKEDLNER